MMRAVLLNSCLEPPAGRRNRLPHLAAQALPRRWGRRFRLALPPAFMGVQLLADDSFADLPVFGGCRPCRHGRGGFHARRALVQDSILR